MHTSLISPLLDFSYTSPLEVHHKAKVTVLRNQSAFLGYHVVNQNESKVNQVDVTYLRHSLAF